MWQNLKRLFSRERLYTETEVRKIIGLTIDKFAEDVKNFNAGAVDVPLDKHVDGAKEKFLKDGPTGGWQ